MRVSVPAAAPASAACSACQSPSAIRRVASDAPAIDVQASSTAMKTIDGLLIMRDSSADAIGDRRVGRLNRPLYVKHGVTTSKNAGMRLSNPDGGLAPAAA